jgi:hypothetical protein
VAKGEMDVNLAGKMGGRRDELADLGRDFDSLAQRLKQLIVGQRRLFHDVSHELRSPLARLNAASIWRDSSRISWMNGWDVSNVSPAAWICWWAKCWRWPGWMPKVHSIRRNGWRSICAGRADSRRRIRGRGQ